MTNSVVDPLPSRWVDVCNGDADGLCAVVQMRLNEPRPAQLVTGLKRDIALLERVAAGPGDRVLVCDLSMRRNADALHRLLANGVQVRYFDHHEAGAVPAHPGLDAHLDMASNTCTSLLVDRYLSGRQRAWAVVGAYGDQLHAEADALAADLGLTALQRASLRALGEGINYNAYGEQQSDVCIAPAQLFEIMRRYADPLEMVAREPVARKLDDWRQADLALALALPAYAAGQQGRVFILPDAAWSRRVMGAMANALSQQQPALAHAVLRPLADGSYQVSVRAPRHAPAGASRLCQGFGGMGRAAAAGIDCLPAHELARFVQAFNAHPWC